MSPKGAQAYLPLVFSLIKGQTLVEPISNDRKESITPFAIDKKGAKGNAENTKTKGQVGVVPISGPVMKYDGECGEPGAQTWSRWIEYFDNAENVDAIVLAIDSPGGMVSGTQSLVDTIKSTSKPVVAFIDDGMAASAAYWIASAADEIIASHKESEVGSIGVYVTLADVYGYYKSQGLEVRDIYSNLSDEKNLPFKDALEGNDDKLKVELDRIAETFIASVKASRGDKLSFNKENTPFKGKLFFADEALEVGLIDNIGPLSFAIGRARALVDANSETNSNSKNMNQFKNINATLGVKELTASEEGVYLNEEQMTSLNEALENGASSEQLSAAEQRATEAEASLEQIKTQVSDTNTLLNGVCEASGIDTNLSNEEKFAAISKLLKEDGAMTTETQVENDNKGKGVKVDPEVEAMCKAAINAKNIANFKSK